jgi:hypothetical protein
MLILCNINSIGQSWRMIFSFLCNHLCFADYCLSFCHLLHVYWNFVFCYLVFIFLLLLCPDSPFTWQSLQAWVLCFPLVGFCFCLSKFLAYIRKWIQIGITVLHPVCRGRVNINSIGQSWRMIFSFLCNHLCFADYCLSFCHLLHVYWIVCTSSIYSFLISLGYLNINVDLKTIIVLITLYRTSLSVFIVLKKSLKIPKRN